MMIRDYLIWHLFLEPLSLSLDIHFLSRSVSPRNSIKLMQLYTNFEAGIRDFVSLSPFFLPVVLAEFRINGRDAIEWQVAHKRATFLQPLAGDMELSHDMRLSN